MSIRKHEPVSEQEMSWNSPRNTICEKLRGIYCSVDDENVRLMCREATAMAKAMTNKLTEYKRNWEEGFFDDNAGFPLKINKKPIDVLFLTYDDNANTGYRFWMCAKYLGLNAVMFKGIRHPFGYPQQAPVHPSLNNPIINTAPITMMAPGIETLMESARVVHLIASTYPMNSAKGVNNVIVQHGGTVYRQNPEKCNAIFNKVVSHSIIQCPDLLGLGAKNEKWIYYPVDTVNLKPDFSRKGKQIVIGHFPSNRTVKGSKKIIYALNKLKDCGLPISIRVDQVTVPWEDNLKRMASCDVIIEGCNAFQGKKKYGEWGNTALEAASLGCAVITHSLNLEMYEKEFGCKFGPLVANNTKQLEKQIEWIVKDGRLEPAKRRCRQWVVENHSIPATADRLWDLVYKDYFG